MRAAMMRSHHHASRTGAGPQAAARMVAGRRDAAQAAPARPALLTRAAATSSGAKPSWEIRMLYDGACPLCMREVGFLMGRDKGKGAIDFVDIAGPGYTAADNAGITYEQAMEKIHAIEADGRIITGIEVFRRLYEAVGLGWIYAATKTPAVARAANAVYDVWAKYRTQLTGREALEVILQRRAAEAAGRGDAASLCGDEDTACEIPLPKQGAAAGAARGEGGRAV